MKGVTKLSRRTAVERRPYLADFAKCGGGRREVEAPRSAKIFILKNLQNSALTSSSFAHPRKLSYRCFIGA